MGRGSCCVSGPYEGLYFISNEDFHVYRKAEGTLDVEPETRLLRELDYEELTGGHWLYDDLWTEDARADILDAFTKDLIQRFPSFSRPDTEQQLSNSQKIILENQLFYICIEDNQWSLAVELIQKEERRGNCWTSFQASHYQRYLDGVKTCLLHHLPSIGVCDGPWTSKTITREELAG